MADGCSTPIDFWDYQLIVYFGYANLSTLLMFCVVAGTRSKYATIASARILLVSVYMEVFFVLVFLCLYVHAGGFSFEEIGLVSRVRSLALSLPPLALFLCLYALFEAKRAPFDHSEAESELVAGHMVEFGGRALLFFYMCEYTHLVFCLFLVVSLCFGLSLPSPLTPPHLYFFELQVIGAC
jgi:NADH-quinone oxidoreductase subunit H